MPTNQTVEQKLNIISKDPKWYLSYGITDGRYKQFNGSGKNSVFNNNSETAKTLIKFGELDSWQQVDNPEFTPRKSLKKHRWDEKFFDRIRDGENMINKNECSGWYNFISKHAPELKPEDFKNSILLFEFELMNASFHTVGSKAFKKLSFLKIESLTKWSKFDAVLILPKVKRLIFFECKLNSDITLNTKGFLYVNQIYRNMESAYLLTKHHDSLYKDWDFNYVFVCPKIEYDYNHKIYSYVIKDIKNGNIGLYKAILCTEYKDKLDDSTNKYLESFIEEAGDKISVAHWEDFP